MRTIRVHGIEFFKGVAQAFFFEEAFFGFLLLALMFAFDRWLFACGFVGACVGYGYSLRFSVPKSLRATGLLPINGLFFGLALAYLGEPSPLLWLWLLSGSLALPLITQACHEIFQHWKLSPSVLPYILAVWATVLGMGLSQPPLAAPAWETQSLLPSLAFSALAAVGRLLFVPDPLFGALLLLLIAVFNPRRGLIFGAGTALATGFGFLIAGHQTPWEAGELAYCAGLTGLALASFHENFTLGRILFFCAVTAFLTLALQQLLRGAGLPVLSLPYVLTLWFAILSRVPALAVSWSKRIRPRSGSA